MGFKVELKYPNQRKKLKIFWSIQFLHKGVTSAITKKGSQHKINAPVTMANVLAAFFSRFASSDTCFLPFLRFCLSSSASLTAGGGGNGRDVSVWQPMSVRTDNLAPLWSWLLWWLQAAGMSPGPPLLPPDGLGSLGSPADVESLEDLSADINDVVSNLPFGAWNNIL